MSQVVDLVLEEFTLVLEEFILGWLEFQVVLSKLLEHNMKAM